MEHKHDENIVNKYEDALKKYATDLNDNEVVRQAKELTDKHKAENNTPETIKSLIGFIDLTSLGTSDTQESILAMVEKVNKIDSERPDMPVPAALCVYPNMAGLVKDSLEADNVRIACVAGGFPSAQTFPEIKTAETSLCIMDGADEIDTVMPVGKYLSGDYEGMADEIDEIKAACGTHKLKVILETCELKTASDIKKASILCMYSGADFIKTSTGKGSKGATPEAAYIMCKAIKEYYIETDRKVGFKAAGGIKTADDALTYYTIVKEVLGKEWLTPELFRIGATGLLDNLMADIEKHGEA